jgi:hypothetical protein
MLLGLSGCASMMASVQYPKPVYLSLSNGRTEVLADKKLSDLFAKYCSGGHQTKSLTFNYSFVSPKNPNGWSIGDASKYIRNLNNHRECLNRVLIFRLAETPDCQTYYGNYVTDLRGKPVCGPANRDEPVWFFTSEKSSNEIEQLAESTKPNTAHDSSVPVFVRSASGKIYGFHFIGNGSSVPNVLPEMTSPLGPNVSSAVLSDLSSLVNTFTLLEPADYQKQAYGSDEAEDEKSCSANSGDSQVLAVDSEGASDTSTAISERTKIWERYISRFSKIKESPDPRSPQITNTQISMDLNGFCKYGRSLNDLTSK